MILHSLEHRAARRKPHLRPPVQMPRGCVKVAEHDKVLTIQASPVLGESRCDPLDSSPAMRILRTLLPALLPIGIALAPPLYAAKAPAKAPARPSAPHAVSAGERPAIDGVLEAFEHADIVALGEQRWGKLDSDFRHQLIADPRFAARVNDIVVEFANARYQPLLDRYLLKLEAVPPDSLRPIWQDAPEPGAWDSPVYAYLLEVVRRANRFRPPEGRVRVLAGAPPIDWSSVQSAADLRAWGSRREQVLGVISREVIAKRRKALLVYGARNFFRRDRGIGESGNLTTNLEARHPGLRVFVVGTVPEHSPVAAALDSALTLEDRPVLLRLADSKVGAWPAARLFEFGRDLLADMADGLLYHGAMDDALVRPTDLVVRDAEYVKEVVRRQELLKR
jgi:hypothetical protein